jgi:cyclohexadienyl dehydratase
VACSLYRLPLRQSNRIWTTSSNKANCACAQQATTNPIPSKPKTANTRASTSPWPARSLADSLGVKVEWVQTTWKTLMPDMLAGKCDIGVGGISVTLERQKKAFFSTTLDVDGKIPLVRCEDQALYQTVEQINQPSVRLVEPAGGTNEAFVQAFLPKAQLRLHDNVTIFQELLDKKADVMITDASEALYQQKLKPGLCAVNPKQFMQYGEKAYLLPRDDMTWKLYVDQWLHLAKVTGSYQKVLGQWIATPEPK